MGKQLAAYVHVNGTVYGPDSDVPADVAKEITNPKAWGENPGSKGDKDGGDEPLTYTSAKVADLKAEIERRNEDRDEEDLLSLDGNKAFLVEVLEADDAAAAAADDDA